MLNLDIPTERISIAQYSALTATGLFFSRYALLVAPVNYMLCSVNIALFGSSAWHLGRKLKADYVDDAPLAVHEQAAARREPAQRRWTTRRA